MTDPQAPGSKPDIEDVVERANAGLAEAEAAGRAATQPRTPAPAPTQPADAAAQQSAADAAPAEPAAPAPEAEPAAEIPAEPASAEPAAAAPAPAETAAAAEAPAAAPADSDSAAGAAMGEEPADAAPAEAVAAPADAPAVEWPEAEAPADAPASVDTPAETTAAPAAAEPTTRPDAAETVVIAGSAAAAASASAAEPAGLTAIAGPRPVYVAAPEPPTPRGNRGAAGLIGLVAAVAFAVLYLGAWTLVDLARGTFDVSAFGTRILEQLSTADLWTPTVVFFLGFWLLGVFVNRARWGYWVVFGILVGLAAYVGHIAGQLAHAQAWNLTYAASEKLVTAELFAPLSIAAFIIGRELTIWFGAWVAARGRKVTALNLAAQEDYERSLEAGPQAAVELG